MDPVSLYSSRDDTTVRFVNFVRYQQGVRAYFLRSPYFRSGLRVLDAGCGSGIITLALVHRRYVTHSRNGHTSEPSGCV